MPKHARKNDKTCAKNDEIGTIKFKFTHCIEVEKIQNNSHYT